MGATVTHLSMSLQIFQVLSSTNDPFGLGGGLAVVCRRQQDPRRRSGSPVVGRTPTMPEAAGTQGRGG